MSELMIIEAEKPKLLTEEQKQLNVVAYCRVSTDKSDQRNSFEAQKRFFEDLFKKNKNWINLGIYADNGISGTSLKHRDEFNNMISLALNKSHPIDLIVTKEVSRFSRNIKDTLNLVEELHNNNVYVWFIANDINTQSTDYRKMLTDYALAAEQESLMTSRRVRFGHQQRMKEGVFFGRKEMFGYEVVKDEDGEQQLKIIEDEAKVVKQIFEWYDAGLGTFRIAKKLQQAGIDTKRYKKGWSNTVILRILRQEKYVGDLLLGKTYTEDPLTHTKKYNNKKQSNQFYFRNHHPEQAIISRELWDSVQQRLKENEPTDEVKAKHNNRYWLSGKIICGICGGKFSKKSKPQKNGNRYIAWDCMQHITYGTHKHIINDLGEKIEVGCNARQINEKIFNQAIKDIVCQVIVPQKDKIINEIKQYITKAEENKSSEKPKIKKSDIDKKLNDLKEKESRLTDFLLDGTIDKEMYQIKKQEIANSKINLQQQINQIETSSQQAINLKIKIDEYLRQIEDLMKLENEELNEELFERITKKFVVHPDHILEIHLSMLPYPIYLQFKTSGRNETYTIEFTVLKELSDLAKEVEEAYLTELSQD